MRMKASERVPSSDGIGVEVRRLDDREIGNDGGEVLERRAQEHVAGEQAVPGGLGNHAHLAAVVGVRADVAVLDEDVAALQVGEQAAVHEVEVVLLEVVVDLAPPDLVLAGGLADDEAVLRGASGVVAGSDHQRTEMSDGPLEAANRLLVESRRREVPERRPDVIDPVLLQSVLADGPSDLLHVRPFLARCGARHTTPGAAKRHPFLLFKAQRNATGGGVRREGVISGR